MALSVSIATEGERLECLAASQCAPRSVTTTTCQVLRSNSGTPSVDVVLAATRCHHTVPNRVDSQ